MIGAVAATAGLGLFDRAEEAYLGKKPVYHQQRLAKRIFGSKKPAPFMRWGYGLTVGLLQEKLRANPLWFGPAVALFELAVLPVPRWPRKQVALLFAHATFFALLVEAASRWKSSREMARSSTS